MPHGCAKPQQCWPPAGDRGRVKGDSDGKWQVEQVLCRACLRSGDVGGDEPPASCPHCGSADVRSSRELFGLTIAHVDCDAFYASVEKRDNPSIRDKPVIVGGRERGVAAACYIARQFGVRSALSGRALNRCPDAVIRPRMNHHRCRRQVRTRMLAMTPLVQPITRSTKPS